MFENTFLSLSGHGYLYDACSYQCDEWCAILNVIQPFNQSQCEDIWHDIWLECRFNIKKFPVFTELGHYLAKDKSRSVILKFDAKYSGFQRYYKQLSEDEDPRFILQLYGELLHVHEYYLEGVNICCCDRHDMKNSRMLHKACAHYKMEPFYG